MSLNVSVTALQGVSEESFFAPIRVIPGTFAEGLRIATARRVTEDDAAELLMAATQVGLMDLCALRSSPHATSTVPSLLKVMRLL
jgi:hypothetical protein